jgi:hypothetical protein
MFGSFPNPNMKRSDFIQHLWKNGCVLCGKAVDIQFGRIGRTTEGLLSHDIVN